METQEINPFNTQAGSELIRKMTFEMKFLGWFNVIYGGLISLTIIGAIVGVPMLISGFRLIDAAKRFIQFSTNFSAETLYKALDNQRTYFRINFWFMIVGIAVFVLYILFIVFMFGTMMDQLKDTPLFS